ncbi:hypothetical protein QNE60_005148, partial [Vibrio harveyi]|nr:hypothetical protein [Vibrio harveyi]
IGGLDKDLFVAKNVKTYDEAEQVKNALHKIFDDNGFGTIWQKISLELKLAYEHHEPINSNDKTIKTLKKIDEIVVPYDMINEFINIERINSLPNQFTGAGLLFTFLGLSYGVYQGSQSIMMVDVSISETIKSLTPLIQASGISFLTSFTGLLCSLEFTRFERKNTYKTEQAIISLAGEISKIVEYTSASHIQYQVNANLIKQIGLLDDIKNDLSANRMIEVSDKFDDSLDSFLEIFVEHLKNHEEDVLENINRAEEKHTLIIGKLSESSEAFSNKFSNVIEELSSSLQKSLSLVTDNGAELTTEFNAAHDRLLQVVSSLEKLSSIDLSDAFDINQIVMDFSRLLNQSNDSLDSRYQETLGKSLEHFETISLDLVRKIYEQIECSHQNNEKKYQELQQPLTHLLDVMPGCVNNLVELNKTYHKGLHNLNRATSESYSTANSMMNVKNDFVSINKSINDTAKYHISINDELNVLNNNIKALSSILESINNHDEDLLAGNSISMKESNQSSATKPKNNRQANSLLSKIFRGKNLQ